MMKHTYLHSNPYYLAGQRLKDLANKGKVDISAYDHYVDSITNAMTGETSIEKRDIELSNTIEWANDVCDIYELVHSFVYGE